MSQEETTSLRVYKSSTPKVNELCRIKGMNQSELVEFLVSKELKKHKTKSIAEWRKI